MSRIRILTSMVLCLLLIFIGAPLCFASGVNAANAGARALKAGDKNKAKVLFKSALRSNELSKENYIIVNNQLADLLRSESKIDEALERYSESLYLNPDDFVARMGRGGLHYQMGQYEKAVEDLTRYTELMPRDPRGYILRGKAFNSLKNYDRAISDLDHAVWLKPENENSYIQRGNTYFKTRNYNLALSDFETALKIDPGNPYACQAMAWVYAACPNPDFRNGSKAVELAQKAVKREQSNPPDPLFPATLAAAYAQSGAFGKAIAAQQQALDRIKADEGGGHLSKKELYRRLQLYVRGESFHAE